jgi:hypothetical protein
MANARIDLIPLDLLGEPANDDNLIKTSIRRIGAALRHNINNPLQEILALTHVVQAGASSDEAIDALQRAATGLAQRVSRIEEEMLRAVEEDIMDPTVQ